MARIRNHVIYATSVLGQKDLVRIAEEYGMLGRDTKLEQGKLTVFALPRKHRR